MKFILVLAVVAVFGTGSLALAQAPNGQSDSTRRDFAVAFDYVRSNAPPGGSGSINLNGGSATLAWPVGHRGLAVVADLTIVHAGNIAPGNYGLTLTTYTGGARYRLRTQHSLQPYLQILGGGARAGGSLVDGADSTTSNTGLAFAANAGGGVDLHLTPRISLRLVEADYLVTTFSNQVNDHQNNFRVSAGFILHF